MTLLENHPRSNVELSSEIILKKKINKYVVRATLTNPFLFCTYAFYSKTWKWIFYNLFYLKSPLIRRIYLNVFCTLIGIIFTKPTDWIFIWIVCKSREVVKTSCLYIYCTHKIQIKQRIVAFRTGAIGWPKKSNRWNPELKSK